MDKLNERPISQSRHLSCYINTTAQTYDFTDRLTRIYYQYYASLQ